MLTCGVGGCNWILQQITAHTAGERLPEVGQELAELGQALRILPGPVVEHQARGGDVEGCGIHRVHRRR